jgi:hypothetical protein
VFHDRRFLVGSCLRVNRLKAPTPSTNRRRRQDLFLFLGGGGRAGGKG